MSSDITFTFDMDSKTHSDLKEMAQDNHRTLAGQIRFILEQYLERKKES